MDRAGRGDLDAYGIVGRQRWSRCLAACAPGPDLAYTLGTCVVPCWDTSYQAGGQGSGLCTSPANPMSVHISDHSGPFNAPVASDMSGCHATATLALMTPCTTGAALLHRSMPAALPGCARVPIVPGLTTERLAGGKWQPQSAAQHT